MRKTPLGAEINRTRIGSILMNNMKTSVDGATKGMRWTARIIGILIGLVWLSQVPGIMDHSSIPLPIPLQVALLVTPLLSVIIAWRWDRSGGQCWSSAPFCSGRCHRSPKVACRCSRPVT